MTRITLIILLGVFMLSSFSAQAGQRNGYNNKHHNGHYKKHHDRHYYSRGHRRHACRHDNHYRSGGHMQVYAMPRFELGFRYAYPGGGAVIVYQQRSQDRHGY